MKKYFFLVAGIFSVAIAFVGIFLPFLPTTPLLLLSLYFFSKSSNRFHDWLLYNSRFSNLIQNYKNGFGVPIKLKIGSIIFLWASTILSSLFFLNSRLAIVLLILISTIITIHILMIRTFEKTLNETKSN
ncbi:MAG: DUF454 family protein [Bacteroidota bacterium]